MNITGIDIYHQLARRNLTWSQRDFSTHLLGMNPSYLAQRGGRPLSERALLSLFRHLWKERQFALAWRIARIVLWEGQTND